MPTFAVLGPIPVNEADTLLPKLLPNAARRCVIKTDGERHCIQKTTLYTENVNKSGRWVIRRAGVPRPLNAEQWYLDVATSGGCRRMSWLEQMSSRFARLARNPLRKFYVKF